jgi:hypothetical protein
MDRPEIVRISMANMMRMYRDWATVARLIEEHLKNEGFQRTGQNSGMWDRSASYDNPEGWLSCSFTAAYWKPGRETRAAGYCMHFGAYKAEFQAKLDARQAHLPAIAVSVLDLETQGTIKKIETGVLRSLFRAGWYDVEHVQIAHQVFVSSDVTAGKYRVKAKAKTFFVDLLLLKSREDVRRLVSEPLLLLYGGQTPALTDPAVMPVSLTPQEEAAAERQANTAGTQG